MKNVLIVCWLLVAGTFANAQRMNVLTDKEKAEGWKLLFDGKSIAGWHTYGAKGVGSAWRIDDQAMQLYNPNRAGNKTLNGGDLVTDEVFTGDFELKIDWKITPKANSGVFLFVQEEPKYKEIFETGLELQVTDNAIFGEGPDNNRRAGDLFNIVSARVREPKPVGEWNQMHVIFRKGTLSVSLNGFQIHEIRLNGPDWKKWVADSKMKDAPFAKGKFSGRIGLQDWGSTTWYRNIKYRKL